MNATGIEHRSVLNYFGNYLGSGDQSLDHEISPVDIKLLHDLLGRDVYLDLEILHFVVKVHDFDLKVSLVPIPKHIFYINNY